jgi:hypothetical protein
MTLPVNVLLSTLESATRLRGSSTGMAETTPHKNQTSAVKWNFIACLVGLETREE